VTYEFDPLGFIRRTWLEFDASHLAVEYVQDAGNSPNTLVAVSKFVGFSAGSSRVLKKGLVGGIDG